MSWECPGSYPCVSLSGAERLGWGSWVLFLVHSTFTMTHTLYTLFVCVESYRLERTGTRGYVPTIGLGYVCHSTGYHIYASGIELDGVEWPPLEAYMRQLILRIPASGYFGAVYTFLLRGREVPCIYERYSRVGDLSDHPQWVSSLIDAVLRTRSWWAVQARLSPTPVPAARGGEEPPEPSDRAISLYIHRPFIPGASLYMWGTQDYVDYMRAQDGTDVAVVQYESMMRHE